ncbi:MAG TPA: HmuY family protein [Candidatus Cryptobacteroides merdipullorum]|uniref:HmuY family protein n=1 Tax=Candidatus Cryptobacteroides merdipullorum TaxID=2840771 RepID=A0A9D1GNA8_9BACT|nr:HmuY family protein [Candidatus Cryptobacteroides merdipullorum]
MSTLRTLISAISATVLLFVWGCNREPVQERVDSGAEGIVVEGLSDDRWTYFSFSESKVVGTSEFGSGEEDALWAGRDDWDIAICGEFLRTNSGTSGIGNGGIQRNTITDFYNLTEAPDDGYLEDVDDIVVAR